MKLDNFMSKLEIYTTASEHQGKLFSVNTVLKDIFRFTDEEIEEEFKKIQEEEKDPLYSKFYGQDEDGDPKW
jgi:predicted SnoaL-like aldol condensation-catalyzing enzyme